MIEQKNIQKTLDEIAIQQVAEIASSPEGVKIPPRLLEAFANHSTRIHDNLEQDMNYILIATQSGTIFHCFFEEEGVDSYFLPYLEEIDNTTNHDGDCGQITTPQGLPLWEEVREN